MYIPSAFAQTDPAKLVEFMRANSFATLVSTNSSGLVANHLPCLVDGDAEPRQIFGHMARANPQWRDVCGEVLVVFAGPHAYISPSWYQDPATVPTWNYLAVHAYGSFRVVDDRDGLLEILRRSVEFFEGPRPDPWPFDASAQHIERMLKAIVGFRIKITRLEGKWKLNQNHPPERRERVVQALRELSSADAQTIAALMAEELT